MMRHICSCLLISFALWCTAAAYGQTGLPPVTVTIYSRLTIESNGLLAECGTNISAAALGFYKNVDSNCILTTNSSIQPDQTVTTCTPSNPSPAFNPSAPGPAPNLKVDCSQIFPLQNLGSIKYTLNSQHDVYTTDAFFNLFDLDIVDPCDFAVPRVGFPISPPSQSVTTFCFIDMNPVGYGSALLGHSTDSKTPTGIDPPTIKLGPKEKKQFKATPDGVTVTWVLDPPSPAASVGTIDQVTGNYVAPDTIPTEQFVTVKACNTSNVKDCGSATIDLLPVSVTITLNGDPVFNVDVLQGQSPVFAAQVKPDTISASGVKWTLDPDQSVSGNCDFNQPDVSCLVMFGSSPQFFASSNVTGRRVYTLRACSNFDPDQCGEVLIVVPLVTVNVTVDPSTLLAVPGATSNWSASVIGAISDVSFVPPPSLAGTFTQIDGFNEQFTVSRTINTPTNIPVMACVHTAPSICNRPPAILTLNPSVVFSVTPQIWPSGQTTDITIAGTGFGNQPTVQLSDPRITFAQREFSSTPTGSVIKGVVTVPSFLAQMTIMLTVTDTSLFNPVQTSDPIVITPVSVALTVTPSTATLQLGQVQQFFVTTACTTAGGSTAQCPPVPITCSITSSIGSMDPTTCTYTATTKVSTQTTISGLACIVGTAICSSFTITLLPPPSLTSIAPSAVTAGSSSFELSLTGSNFVPGAQVQLNGTSRKTVFVSPIRLTASIDSVDVSSTSQLSVAVIVPGSTAQSSSVPLTVTTNPIPLISNLTPPRVIACDPALSTTPCPSFKLIVNGSFFPSGALVQIDGVSCATTVISANQLTATILPADLTRSRFASIKVFNPTTGQLGANDAPLAVFRYGDLGFDNSVSVNDLLLMANILAGNITPLDSTPGDVLLDGKINITDLNTLANFLAGNINHLPIIPDQTAVLFNAGAPVKASPPTFAGQTVGTTSDPLVLTLTNGGPTPLSISSVNIAPVGEFTQTNNCVSLTANASCTINVTFTPTGTGKRSATLTVTDNAGNSPQTADLSGTGIGSAAAPTAAPTAALSSSLGITDGPVTLMFSSQTVGTNSALQRIRLINTGSTALSISGINIAPSGEFTESDNCGTSLAAGTSCNINVTFSPAASGTRTATLTVTDNASNSPQTATLTGIGGP